MAITFVYAHEEPPQTYSRSMFLAGPSPRKAGDPEWRSEACRILQEIGYDGGVVFLPVPRDGNWFPAERYEQQIEWETKYLNMADVVVFWIPRNMEHSPALTTNIEWGAWFDSGKALLGYPDSAPHMKYLEWHAKQAGVPSHCELGHILNHAVLQLGQGAVRTGGERAVPLHLWQRADFQQWYKAQVLAGNRLDGAKVVWTFRVGPHKERVFFWALHVDVFIGAEQRHKVNEIVIFRPDISTIVAFHQPTKALDDTRVVRIRKFRSPAAPEGAMIRDVPGGSSWKPQGKQEEEAAKEFQEETGMAIEASRLVPLGARQIAGTAMAHKAHAYACRLTDKEIKVLQAVARCGAPHGQEADSERTYVEVWRLGDILEDRGVDWSNLGMIFAALRAA